MNDTGPGRLRHVRHARTQAAADKGQVRVGIRGLDGPLLRRQLRPAIEIVVVIAGAFGKHGREEVDVGTDSLRTRSEPRRKALRKIAGGRVRGAVQATVVLLE